MNLKPLQKLGKTLWSNQTILEVRAYSGHSIGMDMNQLHLILRGCLCRDEVEQNMPNRKGKLLVFG